MCLQCISCFPCLSYISCLKRTCCNIVNVTEDELEKVADMNQVTQRFLVKRASIINCLFTLISLDMLIMMILFILTFAGTSVMTIAGDKSDVINGLVIITVLIIYLSIDTIQYQIIKRWSQTWSDYKTSVYYSKCMAVILYLFYPIISSYTYSDNPEGNTIKLFLDVINTAISIISTIHIFILRTNSLVKEVNNSYEYKIISNILKAIYIPVVMIVFGIMIDYTKDPLIISFAFCYFVLITCSLFIRDSVGEKIEELFSLGCFILFIAIIGDNDLIFFGIIIKIYINYIVTSVVVIDLTNEMIMKNRANVQESGGGITCIMKDTEFGTSDLQRLISSSLRSATRETKESYESVNVVETGSEIIDKNEGVDAV